MDNTEKTRLYNKQYYATNKERISTMLLEKVVCPHCNRTVNHQNLHRHQSTKLCKSRRPDLSSNEVIQDLILKLQTKLI